MNIDFEALLAQSPNPYVVLDPDLVLVWMNEAYLRATMRRREDIIGRSMFDAFPSDPESESHLLLKHSLERVLETGERDELALIRYDIRNPDQSMDARYWSATHSPILGADGKVAFVLQHTVDVTELHELRSLRDGAALVERANAVQARNRDLAEESEQLRNLLEKAPGFVGVLSGPSHIFIMANEAYRRLVGERDLVGHAVADALPEVVEQGFIDLLDQVHASRNAHVALRQKVTLRNAPTGESQNRFLDFIYQPIFTDSGEVSGVLVQGQDVTDQIEAEEHQKRLINELNHRVKNTLAVVQGLATQSFTKSPTPADGLRAFTARLAALSAAHNLLTRANWEAARLDDVLRAGIEATAGFHQERFRMSGPAVTLQPQVATSVAMLVHELSTNALKHGALASPEGWVDIRWSIAASDTGRELAFDWSEQGGPRIDTPARRGFGTRLIERGFASDRASSVSMAFPPTGLQCRIVAHIEADAA